MRFKVACLGTFIFCNRLIRPAARHAIMTHYDSRQVRGTAPEGAMQKSKGHNSSYIHPGDPIRQSHNRIHCKVVSLPILVQPTFIMLRLSSTLLAGSGSVVRLFAGTQIQVGNTKLAVCLPHPYPNPAPLIPHPHWGQCHPRATQPIDNTAAGCAWRVWRR
jgi:hypothetical protein